MTAGIVFATFGLLIQGLYIFFEQKKIYNRSLPLKVFASFQFFLVGFIGFLSNDFSLFNLFIVLGLLFGVFGDFFLSYSNELKKEKRFKVYAVGIASFLIGHIFYIVSLMLITNNILLSLLVGTGLALVLIFVILFTRKFEKIILIFGIIYIVVLMNMFSFALFNLIGNVSKLSIIFFIGAALFSLSDLVIVFNTFGKKKSRVISIINLVVYYIAQLLIAFVTLI